VDGLKVSLRCITTEKAPGTAYRYPEPLTAHFKRSHGKPGVYRWLSVDQNRHRSIYIGEAEDIGRRLAGYLCPGAKQQTNIRVKQFLDDRKLAGAAIELQILDFDPFSINDLTISPKTLTNSYVRKLVENLAIAAQQSELCTIVNRGTDFIDKTLVKLADLIPNPKPGAREQFIRAAKQILKSDRNADDELNPTTTDGS
jgi:hypothetical protein